MPFDLQSLGLDRLTTPEKLELIDTILESLPEQVDPSEISPAQWEEIRRRCAESDANPGQGRPWREVLDELRTKLASPVASDR
jgi:putative addiction module component (TIGR02574 family)